MKQLELDWGQVGPKHYIVTSEYDEFVPTTAKFDKPIASQEIANAMYAALGLAGEAGETVDKIKKWHRDGVIDYVAVGKELGDVLYYLTTLAHQMGFSLAEIAEMNMRKLKLRQEQGKIHGNGDNREEQWETVK